VEAARRLERSLGREICHAWFFLPVDVAPARRRIFEGVWVCKPQSGRPYAFLPDATGHRPCRAVVGLSVGDLRRFLARIGPKNGLQRTLSRERGRGLVRNSF